MEDNLKDQLLKEISNDQKSVNYKKRKSKLNRRLTSFNPSIDLQKLINSYASKGEGEEDDKPEQVIDLFLNF